MATFLDIVSGRLKQIAAIASSAGAGDAGKIPQTDGSGRLDPSFMPVGFGDDLATIVASENLASGDFVNVWDDGGTISVRKADATAQGKEADGFVLDSFTAAEMATVYFEGTNTGLSGLTLGGRYYLSAATPGGATTTPPAGSGNVVQYLGRATSATSLAYESTDGVTLA